MSSSLKTLKDIEVTIEGITSTSPMALRQAAREWVEQLEENHDYFYKVLAIALIDDHHKLLGEYQKDSSLIWWIKHFFNLDEDEDE